MRSRELKSARHRRLRRLNMVAAVFHVTSAMVMLALSNDFTIPITAAFAAGPPGAQQTWPAQVLWTPPFAALTVSFLFVSALFHLLVVFPGVSSRYLEGIDRGRAPFRWAEYTISSSIMIVPIAMLTGITDIAALIALVGVNMAMIWFGDLQERTPPQAGGWWPFRYGCLAGAVPWIAIGVYLVGAGSDVPGFVYAIYVSLFLLFNVFALVMVLHYRGLGRWRTYVFGEQSYIVLSFVAKSALAWQVFSGTLAG